MILSGDRLALWIQHNNLYNNCHLHEHFQGRPGAKENDEEEQGLSVQGRHEQDGWTATEKVSKLWVHFIFIWDRIDTVNDIFLCH